MKFGLVLLAISMAILGVQSAGAPATAHSVYVDVQIKICSSLADFWKPLGGTRDSIYATWASDNKTVIGLAKSCNDSITSEVKKVLGPLAAVTNADIQAELLIVNAAVTGVQNLIVLAAASFAASDLAVSVSLGTTLFGFNTLITATFNTMLATVATSVTDASFNVNAKIADCEKANFALYDAIWKQVSADVTVCVKSYATDDKYVIGNWTLLFKLILSEALTATNNITLCIKSNALTDAKSIIAANNCTVGALITCFDLGNAEAIAFVTAFTTILTSMQAFFDAKQANFAVCLTATYTTASVSIAALSTPLIACVNNPA